MQSSCCMQSNRCMEKSGACNEACAGRATGAHYVEDVNSADGQQNNYLNRMCGNLSRSYYCMLLLGN